MAHVLALDPELLEFARALRVNATDAERLVWTLVRNRRLDGFKFRRQHPFGTYILDFYCAQAGLAVEIDGGQHFREGQERYDAPRTEYLHERGVRVLRFTNRQVLLETEGVLEVIWLVLLERTAPSP